MSTRREFFLKSVVGGVAATASAVVTEPIAASASATSLAESSDPIFEKPDPLSLAELAKRPTSGVSAVEVDDYAPGKYAGALTPNPPHADLNPKKAVIVYWKNSPCRLVFSHEASYIPILELPDGTGMCNDYYASCADGADIMSVLGREEKNNFVDVVRYGPEQVWVRWVYLLMSKKDDRKPRLRGMEDYLSFQNGLTLRRLKFESLIPDLSIGYSTGAVALYGVLAHGMKLSDCLEKDRSFGDTNVLTMVDLYSDRRYDLFWDENAFYNDGKAARRVGIVNNGDDDFLEAFGQSPGCALVIPFRKRLLFAVLGAASGFDPKRSQLVDISVGPTGGSWPPTGEPSGSSKPASLLQDHWPIGWSDPVGVQPYVNSELPSSPYVFHFGCLEQFFVPKGQRIKNMITDPARMAEDIELGKWVEKRIFYTLLGSTTEWSEIRRIGRQWLDAGANCARPETVATIRTETT